MLTIAASCPRCLEPRTTLQLAYSDPVVNINQPGLRETAFRCAHCKKLVAVTLRLPQNLSLDPLHPHLAMQANQVKPPSGDIAQFKYIEVVDILPHMPVNDEPAHLPERVTSAYLDGLEILSQHRWTPAAGSFRTAIDRSTKLLWTDNLEEEKMPLNLGKRIKRLAEKMDIPASMIDWADAVRVVGNDIHDIDDVTEDDARDAAHFTEVFLVYTYTLPKRLADFRDRRKREDDVQIDPAI